MTTYSEVKKQIVKLRDESDKALPQHQLDRAVERCVRAEELRIEPPTSFLFVGGELDFTFGERGSLYVTENGLIRGDCNELDLQFKKLLHLI